MSCSTTSHGGGKYSARKKRQTGAILVRRKSVPRSSSLQQEEKRSLYQDRVLETEKGSFEPLVFLTTGGSGPSCTKVIKRVSAKKSDKKGEQYALVIGFIRTRLRFSLLRSVLIAVRGMSGEISKGSTYGIYSIQCHTIMLIICLFLRWNVKIFKGIHFFVPKFYYFNFFNFFNLFNLTIYNSPSYIFI